jgi:hypothetical protein
MMLKKAQRSKSAQKDDATAKTEDLDLSFVRLAMWQRVFATYVAEVRTALRLFANNQIDETMLYAHLQSYCYVMRAVIEQDGKTRACGYAKAIYEKALATSQYDKRLVGRDPPVGSELN